MKWWQTATTRWSWRCRGENALALLRCPALQRYPEAAVEPEAVARRRGGEGADPQKAHAGPLETAFLQHPARRRIAHPRACQQRVIAELAEGMVDQDASRLGGVASAPERNAEPIADLRRVAVELGDAAGADDASAGRADHEGNFVVDAVGGRKEGLRIGEPIRMRNARRVRRDAAVVGQRGNSPCVLEARCAQDQPRGFQDRKCPLPNALRRSPIQQCHRPGSFKSEEGSRPPVSPHGTPVGSAGSMGAGRPRNLSLPSTRPQPPSSDAPIRRSGLWLWYGTRPCRR